MSHVSMILTALMMMAMVVFIAPNIFALNRGHILRNVALWLAIFLGLGLVYQNFGPDSPHPLFQAPESMAGMHPMPMKSQPTDAQPKSDPAKDNETQGFIPPKE